MSTFIPRTFEVSDWPTIERFVTENSFCTLITPTEAEPLITHIPVLVKPGLGKYGALQGHVARVNPHSDALSGPRRSVAVFQGPHCYVSPAWYPDMPQAPTWNYSIVHLTGSTEIIENADDVSRLLDETIARYEREVGDPWDRVLPADYRNRMEKGIVAFQMVIDRVECQFKMNQNQTVANRAGVIAALTKAGGETDLAVAQMVEALND